MDEIQTQHNFDCALGPKLRRVGRSVHCANLTGFLVSQTPHAAMSEACERSRRLLHMTAMKHSRGIYATVGNRQTNPLAGQVFGQIS